ncbi:MAG: response regulator [Thermomicrobiales bacterium]
MARVLLVEDNPLLQSLLSQLLTRLGHEVVAVRDGREALAQMRQHLIDVILTDLLMPEVDGLEVILAVRRDYPGVAVIAMSGGSARFPSADALHTARTLGAHAILPKPFNATHLREVIADVLVN